MLIASSAAYSASEAGFPVMSAVAGGGTFTYLSVRDPEAKNLDGSR